MESLKLNLSSREAEAFYSFLDLLKSLGCKQETELGERDDFPYDVFSLIMKHVFSPDFPSPSSIDHMINKCCSKYCDFSYFFLRFLRYFVPFCDLICRCSQFLKDTERSETFYIVCLRIYKLLLRLRLPEREQFDALQKLTSYSGAKLRDLRHEYTICWLNLLPFIPDSKLEPFLLTLSTRILPNLTQPCLLADFLSRYYHLGGLKAILSLEGVFYLLRNHNLDFPDFYDYLYALLTVDNFISNYKIQLMKSLVLFMSSTMIPAYIVAGIIKRLGRLLFSVPIETCAWMLSFMYNLFFEHPATRSLIQRTSESPTFNDPYDPDVPQLSRCHAIDSCLWELESIESHYSPKISRLAFLFKDKFLRTPFNMHLLIEDFKENLIYDIVMDELQHKWSKAPPINNSIEGTLFS